MRWVLWIMAAVLGCSSLAWASDGVTGLVVDASHLPLKRARFPRVFDEAGELLYPPPKLCEDPNYQGFEGYQPTLTEARADKTRVGAKPLIVKALKVKDKDPLEGSVVISAADAEQVRALNAKATALLDKDKIAIVIGLAVVQTKPAADSKDVAEDAIVEVVFSKPLSDDSARSAALVTVKTAEGAAVAGSTLYAVSTKTATFRPSSSWAKGTTYTVVVDKNAEAEGLGRLDGGYQFSFTTVVAPKEAGGAATADGGDGKKQKDEKK
ncbi:MAG: Ig-like domain-containing protein [Armatimonadetes bacterium]|nr:Ig-like domain-containing protein [Armatimonadota bacterium]